LAWRHFSIGLSTDRSVSIYADCHDALCNHIILWRAELVQHSSVTLLSGEWIDEWIDPGQRRRGSDDETFHNSIRSMFFNKRDGTGFAAKGRQQAIGSGETEATNGLQICRNGQGHQAVGWRLHAICF
jgi:hypothetical protein